MPWGCGWHIVWQPRCCPERPRLDIGKAGGVGVPGIHRNPSTPMARHKPIHITHTDTHPHIHTLTHTLRGGTDWLRICPPPRAPLLQKPSATLPNFSSLPGLFEAWIWLKAKGLCSLKNTTESKQDGGEAEPCGQCGQHGHSLLCPSLGCSENPSHSQLSGSSQQPCKGASLSPDGSWATDAQKGQASCSGSPSSADFHLVLLPSLRSAQA